VSFDTYHSNDQPDNVRAVTDNVGLPVVAAEVSGGEILVLLDGAALEACDSSITKMMDAMKERAKQLKLTWPEAKDAQ
jgi:hypothetical protein